jgi:hypothetical protein
LAKSHSFELAQTIWIDKDPGSDLAERFRPLENSDVDSPSNERIRGG